MNSLSRLVRLAPNRITYIGTLHALRHSYKMKIEYDEAYIYLCTFPEIIVSDFVT